MNFTFGIITDDKNKEFVDTIISSIENQEGFNLQNNEIIVVGGGNPNRQSVTHIPFDETIKLSHITKKKNDIFKAAKFENIAIGHDYVSYCPGFLKSFENFDNFDVAMVKIKNKDGTRFREWILFTTEPGVHPDEYAIQWLDYNCNYMTHKQYISGAFWVAKKGYMLNHLLDESKGWASSEDLAFAYQCRPSWNLKMNQTASVIFLKQKDLWPPKEQAWNWRPEYEIK